jgi:hypothetical protein
MATQEEQQHAARLLKIHKRNLERLEEKKAKLGTDLDLGLENQIEEEKANIAALEPIANPPVKPSPKIEAFVKQTTPGEIDLLMLYIQGTQLNQRMTKAEEQNQHIIEEQSRASIDRMQTKEDISTLMSQVSASEQARKRGAKWYRRAITMSLSVAILALLVGCAALAAVLR